MRTNLIIVDDFYNNVDEVRKYALSQNFHATGNYPGVRTGALINDSTRENIQKIVEPHGGKITDWFESEEYTGAFQMTTALERSWVHSDNVNKNYVIEENRWGGVLYLTPDAPLEAGTSFYRSKLNNSIYNHNNDELNQYSQDMTKWELVSEVHNVYNRLILFRADQWHTSQVYFGNTMETGRLTQVFFFTTEY